MGELLLELLSEEIPARMQRRAIDDLLGLIRDKLAPAEIPAAALRGYVTPRRLAVIAEGIPERQPDRREERRGPRVGAPPASLDGFLRAAGLASIDQCEVRDTERGQFYFAVLDRPGRETAAVLPELLHAAIVEVPWPKSMRFPASRLRWVRPLNSVVCLFDGAVVPLALDDIPIGRATRGHRFLSPGEIAVDNATDYLAKLDAAHVVLDHGQRREQIAKELDRLAAGEGLRVKDDPGLLDEVAGLVEYPVVFVGTIDDESMALPPEVLATVMRTHQKYFSCLRADGGPAPRFLFVANNKSPDGGRTIVAGNERVLRARLADARFFWDQDRKVRLEDRVEALKERVYYDKLGTMYDKAERMARLAGFLAQQIAASPTVTPAQAGVQGNRSGAALDSRFRGNGDGELTRLVRRAAHLAKADLSTGMVGEFPELQGVMGRYYALQDGEDPRVADAIADHYKPLGPNDACPTAPVSVIVALADKLDSLVGFYGIDEKPTGSRDPFALRRAALGIVRIILENRLHLSLNALLNFSFSTFPNHQLALPVGLISYNILTFVVDRMKIHVRDRGVRTDLIAASVHLEPLRHDDDLVRIVTRQETLASFLDTEDGANLLVAFRRAANILRIEEGKDRTSYNWDDYRALSDRPLAESVLANDLNQNQSKIDQFVDRYRFGDAMAVLATIRRPVDEFFDKVTVNTDEKAVVDGVEVSLRENRLRLLSRIRAVMNQVADFSQIEG